MLTKCTYKWPTSWAATMIPENPPVSSTMATELTFSKRLFTTQAPPTYANPKHYFLNVRPNFHSTIYRKPITMETHSNVTSEWKAVWLELIHIYCIFTVLKSLCSSKANFQVYLQTIAVINSLIKTERKQVSKI